MFCMPVSMVNHSENLGTQPRLLPKLLAFVVKVCSLWLRNQLRLPVKNSRHKGGIDVAASRETQGKFSTEAVPKERIEMPWYEKFETSLKLKPSTVQLAVRHFQAKALRGRGFCRVCLSAQFSHSFKKKIKIKIFSTFFSIDSFRKRWYLQWWNTEIDEFTLILAAPVFHTHQLPEQVFSNACLATQEKLLTYNFLLFSYCKQCKSVMAWEAIQIMTCLAKDLALNSMLHPRLPSFAPF